MDNGAKHLNIIGKKVFSFTNVQFQIASYQTMLAKYDFTNYSKFLKFKNKFPLRTGPNSKPSLLWAGYNLSSGCSGCC